MNEPRRDEVRQIENRWRAENGGEIQNEGAERAERAVDKLEEVRMYVLAN